MAHGPASTNAASAAVAVHAGIMRVIVDRMRLMFDALLIHCLQPR
jgi:hypothetical protein